MICDTTFTARGDTDPRATELHEMAVTEGYRFRIGLKAAIEFTLWLEDRGFYVDFRSGVAIALVDDAGKEDVFQARPSGVAVNHLLSSVTDADVEQTIDGIFTGPEDKCAPDGTLQEMIFNGERDAHSPEWYAAEAEDCESDRLDREDWSRGQW